MKKRVAAQVVILATAIVVSVIPVSTAARAQDPNVVQARNCRGVLGTTPAVNAEVVREEGRIPGGWTLREPTGPGSAELWLVGISCEAADLSGGTRPIVYTTLSTRLDNAKLRYPSTSNIGNADTFNLYLISWTTNDSDFARFLEEGTGLEDRVQVADGLEFKELAEVPGIARFKLEALPPTPSPFEFSGNATAGFFPLYPVASNFWAENSSGEVVMIETSNPQGDLLGQTQEWTLEAAVDSPLARMMGEKERSFSCNPAESPDHGCFQNETTPLGQWRKCFQQSATPCEKTVP